MDAAAHGYTTKVPVLSRFGRNPVNSPKCRGYCP